MTMGKNRDGTMDVRIVLNVRVDPKAWAEGVMDEHPDEPLLKEIRRSVKTTVRDHVKALVDEEHSYPVLRVHAEGIYD